jgi:LPS-assembly lipoprotein
MQRRQLLQFAASGPLLGLGALGGCGFQLRGNFNYAFNSIHIRGSNPPSLFMLELQRALQTVDGMQVYFAVPRQQTPQVTLDVLKDLREKIAVGVGVAGQVREFQITQRLTIRLRSADGTTLIDDAELTQIRQISYTESAALAKESEEATLHRDMQSDLVVQVMRRLASIKSL